jgi:hypothetical protein
VTLIALISAIVIASSSLAWEFEQRGFSSFAVWILIFGAVWLLAIWRRWKWYSPFALISATILAALGLYLDFNPGWMFAGGVFALFAWDMSEFRQRLHLMAADDDTRGIERRHLARMSLLMLAGLFLASIVMLIRVQFTFEWGVFLVAVILLGLAQLVGWFKR